MFWVAGERREFKRKNEEAQKDDGLSHQLLLFAVARRGLARLNMSIVDPLPAGSILMYP